MPKMPAEMMRALEAQNEHRLPTREYRHDNVAGDFRLRSFPRCQAAGNQVSTQTSVRDCVAPSSVTTHCVRAPTLSAETDNFPLLSDIFSFSGKNA
jgi:hypothetical protein